MESPIRFENVDINQILKTLPHRNPFLLIDRVINIREDYSGIGIKNVTFNEPCFQGHFPERPVFPGVLMVEDRHQLVPREVRVADRERRGVEAVVPAPGGEHPVLGHEHGGPAEGPARGREGIAGGREAISRGRAGTAARTAPGADAAAASACLTVSSPMPRLAPIISTTDMV